jgi:hypothetical protein
MMEIVLIPKENVLDDIECFEPVDLDCLNRLLTSDLLINNFKNPFTRDLIGCEKKQLLKYKSLIDTETKLAKVKYVKVSGMKYGRRNPNGAVGMFQMRKMVRNSLGKRKGLRDVDIINAHPKMTLQLCKKFGLACSKLEIYVLNREAILQKVMSLLETHYNIIGWNAKKGEIRDRAKNLFIRLLYYGTFGAWCKEEKDEDGKVITPDVPLDALVGQDELLNYISELTAELKSIGENIMSRNPKLVKDVEKNNKKKKKKNPNLTGGVVSFFLQEYEARILEVVYLYCKEQGYIENNVCVLCADGIMLEERLIQDADILNEFKQVVNEKTGFDLDFDFKELDGGLTDEEIDAHQLSADDLDKTKFEKFDVDYFISLSGYQRKKIYFELFVCKILRPNPTYAYRETAYDYETKTPNDDVILYTQAEITNTFCHLGSGNFNNFGVEGKFITEWLSDERIKCYNRMDFLPYNDKDKDKIDKSVFNLFRGYNKQIDTEYNVNNKDKILKPFLELGLEICGGEQPHWDYLLDYLADIVQNPQRKCPIAFIVKGKQGTGKNVFLNAVGNVLGKPHYISSSNAKDFFGDYAEGFYHKLLVNINECEGKDTFDFEGKLKSFITEDEITLNAKFVRPVRVLNLSRLLIFTNKPNPIPIDVRSKDRRYVVYETTDKYLDPRYGTEFWKGMINHFKRPEFVACLYDLLNERDISNFSTSRRPITKAYIQMCKLYVPTEVLFLQNKIANALESDAFHQIAKKDVNFEEEAGYKPLAERFKDGVCGSEIFKEYSSYCKEFGFHKDGASTTNPKKFYSALTELNIPGLVFKHPQNKTFISFNPDLSLKYFKERNWIDKSDDDLTPEKLGDNTGEDFQELFDVF